MSHFPGSFLEDWIIDWHMIVDADGEHGDGWHRMCVGRPILNKEQFAELVAIYEPLREQIENKLSDYQNDGGDAEHSWRDWSSYAFDWIPKDTQEAADVYLKLMYETCLKTKGIYG